VSPSPPKFRRSRASPAAEVQRAEREAADAAAAVEARSRERLTQLIQSQPAARLAALTDPDLTPVDRTTLRRSLQAELRRTGGVLPRPERWLRSTAEHVERRRGALLVLATIALALALAYRLAASRNGETAFLPAGATVALTEPDGVVVTAVLNPGWLKVRPLDSSRAEARWWSPAVGYRTAVLPRPH
jgi:hypothetical protein